MVSGCVKPQTKSHPSKQPALSSTYNSFTDSIEKEKSLINKGVIWDVGTPGDPFPYVCSVFGDNGSLVGSGVLISRYTVITAAHCNSRHLAFVSFDAGITMKEVECSTDHPLYQGKKGTCGSFADISLLVLKKPIKNIDPICMNSKNLTPNKNRGDLMVAIGFGNGVKSYTKNSSCWYYGTMEGGDLLLWAGSKTHVENGDSGGAVLLLSEDSPPVLCGVISSRLQCSSGKVIHSAATRIDMYIKWVTDNWRNTDE